MDNKVEKRPFNLRAFTSIALLISVSLLPVSGIMNHQLQFDLLTPARHFWMSVHNMSATLFVAFAVIHVSLNWRALTHYAMKVKGVMLSREALVAFVVIICVVGVFAPHAFHVS